MCYCKMPMKHIFKNIQSWTFAYIAFLDKFHVSVGNLNQDNIFRIAAMPLSISKLQLVLDIMNPCNLRGCNTTSSESWRLRKWSCSSSKCHDLLL